MIKLITVKKSDPLLKQKMDIHYSKPKGFVGRSICYAVYFNSDIYGFIVGGSATMHLVGRNEFLKLDSKLYLNEIINNIFYHVEPINGKYPCRNFTTKVILEYEKCIVKDWIYKYGDEVIALETLVEIPRTGECYRRAGWTKVGVTKGQTCKRIGGFNLTESFGGTRVWDIDNLRPKYVFMKKLVE